MRAIIRMIASVSIKPTQRGASTHHHDHVIVPMSLSVMKTIVSNPRKPTPPLLELLLELLLLL
jgi:hypothetical protein